MNLYTIDALRKAFQAPQINEQSKAPWSEGRRHADTTRAAALLCEAAARGGGGAAVAREVIDLVGDRIGLPKEEVQSIVDWAQAKNHQMPGFSFEQIGGLEPRKPSFLIEALIGEESFCEVIGDPGAAKSFFGQHLGLSVATGCTFLGRSVKQGAVYYLCGEGRDGVLRRAAAWATEHGVDLTSAPFYISSGPALLCDNAFAQRFERAVEECGNAPRLIIVDTLSRNFGADENSTSDMAAFISRLDAWRTRWGCTIIVVHHTGQGDKTRGRGSSALKGALDAEFLIKKVGSDLITLQCLKMKDFEEPHPITLRLVKSVCVTRAGEFIESAVLREEKPTRAHDKKAAAVDALRAAIVERGVLRKIYRGRQPVQCLSNVEAKSVIYENVFSGQKLDTGRRSAARLLEALEADKIIEKRADFVCFSDKAPDKVLQGVPDNIRTTSGQKNDDDYDLSEG